MAGTVQQDPRSGSGRAGSELREEQHKAHLWHQLQPAAAAATVNFYPSFFHIWMQLGAILARIMQWTDARSSYVDFSEL